MGELVGRNNDLFREGDPQGWTYSEEVADGVTGDPIIIEPFGKGDPTGTVKLVCGSGTGKVQTTIDPDGAIEADTAEWDDWAQGEVTGTALDVFAGPISAIRAVSVSGAVTLKILI